MHRTSTEPWGRSPAGTNIERAEPRWMRAGDTAVCMIEGIDPERHSVVADDTLHPTQSRLTD